MLTEDQCREIRTECEEGVEHSAIAVCRLLDTIRALRERLKLADELAEAARAVLLASTYGDGESRLDDALDAWDNAKEKL